MTNNRLNEVLLELHAGCRQRTVAEFKDWALDLTSSVVPFPKALWSSGVLVDGGFQLFSSYVRGVDADFARRLSEMSHLDKRGQEIVTPICTTILRDSHDPLDTPAEIRDNLLDPAGIRFGLVSCPMFPNAGVFDAISLMREFALGQFTEDERLYTQALVPHLHQARMANQIERASDILDAGLRASYHTLVATKDGLVVAAESGATTLMLQEWPDWPGGRLPRPLTSSIATAAAQFNAQPTSFRGHHLVARINPGAEQVLVRLRSPNVVDTLGQREFTVAVQFASGASYKEIAKLLKLSPSTVSNQLTIVYAKLGISNKSELLRLLDHWR